VTRLPFVHLKNLRRKLLGTTPESRKMTANPLLITIISTTKNFEKTLPFLQQVTNLVCQTLSVPNSIQHKTTSPSILLIEADHPYCRETITVRAADPSTVEIILNPLVGSSVSSLRTRHLRNITVNLHGMLRDWLMSNGMLSLNLTSVHTGIGLLPNVFGQFTNPVGLLGTGKNWESISSQSSGDLTIWKETSGCMIPSQKHRLGLCKSVWEEKRIVQTPLTGQELEQFSTTSNKIEDYSLYSSTDHLHWKNTFSERSPKE
jgi:hypothetical protein